MEGMADYFEEICLFVGKMLVWREVAKRNKLLPGNVHNMDLGSSIQRVKWILMLVIRSYRKLL